MSTCEQQIRWLYKSVYRKSKISQKRSLTCLPASAVFSLCSFYPHTLFPLHKPLILRISQYLKLKTIFHNHDGEKNFEFVPLRISTFSLCLASISDLRWWIWGQGICAHVRSHQLLWHCQQARFHRCWVLRTLVFFDSTICFCFCLLRITILLFWSGLFTFTGL